jgi:hypothetical protein
MEHTSSIDILLASIIYQLFKISGNIFLKVSIPLLRLTIYLYIRWGTAAAPATPPAGRGVYFILINLLYKEIYFI